MQLLSLIQRQDLLRVGRPGSIFGFVREGSLHAPFGQTGGKKLAGTVPSALKFVADSVLEIQSIVSLLSGFLLDFVCAVLLDFTTTTACIRVCNIYMDQCVQLIFPYVM